MRIILKIFVFLILINKTEAQNSCFLDSCFDTKHKIYEIKIEVLNNTFNHKYDTTDYFSSIGIASLKIIRRDSLPPLILNHNDSTINFGESSLYICYKSDSLAEIAFNNLIYNIKNPGNIFSFFINGGIVLGIKNNVIILMHSVDYLGIRDDDIFFKCKILENLKYHPIYYHIINLEKHH